MASSAIEKKHIFNPVGARKWLTIREGSTIEIKGDINHKHWLQEMTKYQSQVVIQQDETFNKVPAVVPGFHTIKLTEYQQSTVQTMITLERKRWINLRSKRGEIALYYSAARVSEMVGSGKTIEILALICLQKHPIIAPDIRSFSTIDRPEKYVGRANLVKVKYNVNNILKPTLICVGASVVEQWLDAIKTFTDLHCLVVHKKTDFENLMTIMENGSVNAYDIVIVKNGHVGNGFCWPENMNIMKKNMIKNPWTMNVLSNYTKKPWVRVVLDDADTLGMPYNVTPIPCKFLWIVSSTNNSKQRAMSHNHQYHNAADLLACHPYGYWRILHNQTINAMLNVTSSDQFIMQRNGLANPKFGIVRFQNIHDKMIGLLGVIDDGTAREVQEMLNNDAFHDAAQKIGIASHSVADIFQSLLGAQYKKYKEAETILAFIETIPEDPKKRKPMKHNPDEDDTFTKSRLLKFEMPKYNYPNLKGLIEETKSAYTVVYNECGKAVERVKDNIKHGQCPVCRCNLAVKNVEVFILKCCDSVYCAGCAIDILGLAKKGAVNMESLCRKCRQKISITNLIYVGTDIDKLDIADKYALVMEEAGELSDDEKSDDGKSDSTDNDKENDKEDENGEYTKVRAIVDFCRGRELKDVEPVDMEVPKLMKGFAKNLPDPKYRKVLVYAFMPSACSEIEKKFNEYDIKYWKLSGDVHKLSKTARKFNKYEGDCVLLIQSEQHYAGLNLQTASHGILYGVPQNVSILTQFLGRGQRIGRTTQFKVMFMVYQNECDYLTLKFGMKPSV